MVKIIGFFLMLLLTQSYTKSASQTESPKVIKSASYLVYEGMDDDIYHLPHLSLRYVNTYRNCTAVKFYTFDGVLLKTIPQPEKDCTHLLDPNAPKPRPVSYTIRYWPAIRIGPFGLFTKGCPGDFIVFQDKHQNPIYSNRCEKNGQLMHVADNHRVEWHTLLGLSQREGFPLDLSKIVKKSRYQGDPIMLAYLRAKRTNPTGNFDKWTLSSSAQAQGNTFRMPNKEQVLSSGVRNKMKNTSGVEGDPIMLAYLKAKQENPTRSFDELMADAHKIASGESVP